MRVPLEISRLVANEPFCLRLNLALDSLGSSDTLSERSKPRTFENPSWCVALIGVWARRPTLPAYD